MTAGFCKQNLRLFNAQVQIFSKTRSTQKMKGKLKQIKNLESCLTFDRKSKYIMKKNDILIFEPPFPLTDFPFRLRNIFTKLCLLSKNLGIRFRQQSLQYWMMLTCQMQVLSVSNLWNAVNWKTLKYWEMLLICKMLLFEMWWEREFFNPSSFWD